MRLFYLLTVFALLTVCSFAQEKPEPENKMSKEEAKKEFLNMVESFGWTRSGNGKLGSQGTISIPQGYRFTGSSGTKKFLDLTGNIPGGDEVGIITTEGLDWWVLFEYENIGYVEDKDKDKLDADEILESLREGRDSANEVRAERGLDKLTITGWVNPPAYNPQTNNLEWGLNWSPVKAVLA